MEHYKFTEKQIELLKQLVQVLFELADNDDSAEGLLRLRLVIAQAATILDEAEDYLYFNLCNQLEEFVNLKEDSIVRAHRPELELEEKTRAARKTIIETLKKL